MAKAQTHQAHVAVQLFEQISFIAMNVRGLNRLPEDDDIHINAALMASIAGMGAESLGASASLGADPAVWMLPPSYHEAKASMEGGAA